MINVLSMSVIVSCFRTHVKSLAKGILLLIFSNLHLLSISMVQAVSV